VRASACARLSVHLVSVPAGTLSGVQRGGDEREFLGPLLSADGCARARTHTMRTLAQITSAAAAAAMHKESGLAHRLTDVALALHAIG
jgi:hypothetical protein